MAQFLLTSKERVRNIIKDNSAASNDALLDAMIESVSAECEKFIKSELKRKQYVKEYELGRQKRRLFLGAYPITTLTTLKYAIDTTDWSEISALGATEYRLNKETGTVRFLRVMNYNPGFVQATFTGGLAGDLTSAIQLYPDLVRSVEMQIAYEFRRKDTPAGNVSTAGGTTTFTREVMLLDKVKAIWSFYERRSY